MARTEIHSITATLAHAIDYIVNPEKTENGRLVIYSDGSQNPYEAAKDFEATRQLLSTGRSTTLAQHLIISFAPNEITPDNALAVGKEIADKLLQNEYQYVLSVHTDKKHVHVHCIFNNINMINGRTFEWLQNQGKVSERKWKKVRELSDKTCEEHGLSVIQSPEKNKGKSYYEWDMNRKDLSWKAKLKFAIDETVMESVDFDDFLQKCGSHGIDVVYNPEHVIDLKFQLREQKENNANAKMTRARTLGWYYETPQIKRRIAQYQGFLFEEEQRYNRSKIIRTDTEKMQENQGLKKWADLQNMKEASRVINVLTKYGIENGKNLEKVMFAKYAEKATLAQQLNASQTLIEDLSEKIKVASTVQQLQPIMDGRKALTGRKKTKYDEANASDISAYREAVRQLKEWYPDSNSPSPEKLKEKRSELIEERSVKNERYKELKSETKELDTARKELEAYLKNEKGINKKKSKELE